MVKKLIPETSREAFHSLDPVNILELHNRIMDALRIIGSGTFEDIARQAKLEPQRVWRRLSECLKAGIVYRPGTKKPLKSGRNGMVWALNNPGESTAPVTEKILPGKSISDFSKKLIPAQTKLF